MIFYTADAYQLAFALANDAADVGVKGCDEFGYEQGGSVLGAEDDVVVQARKGLGHETSLERSSGAWVSLCSFPGPSGPG